MSSDAHHFPHIQLADSEGLYQRAQEYLSWLALQNYSPVTVKGREESLYWFIEWCGQRHLHRPGQITKPIVERYQRHLFHYRKQNGQPLAFSSQHRLLVSVRMWFKWLARENYILYNPASDIDLPKVGKRLPKAVLTPSEAEHVLSQPEIDNSWGLRDRAILEVFYSTGLRRMELVRILVADVDSARGTLFVRQGKGQVDRMVPIGERALLWVDKYLDEARPQLACGKDDGQLFLGRFGGAIPLDSLSRLVRKYVRQANVNKPGSCHLFRHTMATAMLENGADIRFIQAMLGHAKLETTEIYTQVSIKKLKEIHTLTHPARVRGAREEES